MLFNRKYRNFLLTTMLALFAFALVSCSSDDPATPTSLSEDTELTTEEIWLAAHADLTRQVNDPAMMEELAPILEEARAQLDNDMLKHRGRFLLTYSTTAVQIVPPPPPPTIHLHIDYNGFGTVLGRHTGFSDSYNDITVVPATQVTTSYSTDAHGDVLDWTSFGYFENSEDGLIVSFWGDITHTGGTGRYDGATGSSRYYGKANNVELAGWFLTWGWLNLEH